MTRALTQVATSDDAGLRRQIAAEYANGTYRKVIAYKYRISSRTVSRIAREYGIEPRNRHFTRNQLPIGADFEIRDMFLAGLDTVTIANRLSITEAKAANALARAGEKARQQ